MSNEPIDDADLLKFIQKERQRLEHISEAERQALIEQRVREVLAQERAVERHENEQEAEILSAELAYDPAKERDRARETAKSAALLLIMLLLILLLIAAATGRTDILPVPGVQAAPDLRIQLRELIHTRGEPIVNTADDAVRSAEALGVDFLVVGDQLFDRAC